MIRDNKQLISYLNKLVDKVFKPLPLFEEKNEGLNTYVDSLLFELYGLQEVISLDNSGDYISLLSTLESIKMGLDEKSIKKQVLRRELFKCIDIIKNMIAKLEMSD